MTDGNPERVVAEASKGTSLTSDACQEWLAHNQRETEERERRRRADEDRRQKAERWDRAWSAMRDARIAWGKDHSPQNIDTFAEALHALADELKSQQAAERVEIAFTHWEARFKADPTGKISDRADTEVYVLLDLIRKAMKPNNVAAVASSTAAVPSNLNLDDWFDGAKFDVETATLGQVRLRQPNTRRRCLPIPQGRDRANPKSRANQC